MRATLRVRYLVGEQYAEVGVRKGHPRLVASAVDFAIEAHRTITATTDELNLVKVHLRVRAEAKRLEDPSVTSVQFEGHLGVAQVVLGKSMTPRARRGMRLIDLKKVLDEETYNSLFVERTVVDVADNYEGAFSALTPSQRTVLNKYVEFAAATPRVNLPE